MIWLPCIHYPLSTDDHSRVVLHVPDSTGNDYINASFINVSGICTSRVSIHRHMYAGLHMHVHGRTHTRAHAHTQNTHTHTYAHTQNTHSCKLLYTLTHAHECANIHIHTPMHKHTTIHAYTHRNAYILHINSTQCT